MDLIARRKSKRFLAVFALGAALLLGVPRLERLLPAGGEYPASAPGTMSFFVFDVGQGDALLAQEGDRQILIDGGPDDRILEKLGRAMPADDRVIELVVLTHPHADHLNGLVAVLGRYSVGRILMTDVSAPTAVFRRWKALVAEKGIAVDDPQKAKNETVGNMGYEVLSSNTGFGILGTARDGNSDGYNDSSIVGMLKFGSRRFLLMGDATTQVEDDLLRAKSGYNVIPAQAGIQNTDTTVDSRFRGNDANIFEGDIKADFLKVGHHGSTYSTSDAFVDAVAPKHAAISVGKNSYGNPAWRVLKLLEHNGIRTYRTDMDGDIVATTDGQSLQVTAQQVK